MNSLTTFNFLLLSIFLTYVFPFSVATFAPVDNFLISSGSATTVPFYTRNFLPDSSASNIDTPLFSCQSSSVAAPSKALDGVFHLHQIARVFAKPSKYDFTINDPGVHIVRLHFLPFLSPNLNLFNAVFHVIIGDHVVLNNFSASESLTIKEYITPVHSGKLAIEFIPIDKHHFAFVNAIELFSAPKDFISDQQFLETVHRVNVGGPLVNPFNDTLWRTWYPDDQLYKSGDIAKEVHFGGRIQYIEGGASREVAPDFVYSTARVISSRNDSVPDVKMIWEFPIVKGYKYLVRLHFCDIASISLNLINFNVYIDGNLVEERLDLSALWNTLAAPIYKDFVVESGDSLILKVAIGPSNESVAHGIDGVLNGVEIMKINNTMGSLDGEVLAGMLRRKWHKNRLSSVQFWVVLCLLTAAFVFLYTTKEMGKNGHGWISLPTSPDSLSNKRIVDTFSKV